MVSEINSNMLKRDGSTYTLGGITDLNDFWSGVAYVENSTKNIPMFGWWLILAAGGNGVIGQVAFNPLDKTVYWRYCSTSVWSQWDKLL